MRKKRFVFAIFIIGLLISFSMLIMVIDMDGDDLPNYRELFESKTNPLQKDTDSDFLSDLEEVEFKTDPLWRDTRRGLSDVSSIASRDPIIIESDFEFTQENGVISGMGTSNEPYVIEGWEIDASKAAEIYSGGITIKNTRMQFVIRNVRVYDGRKNSRDGIEFENIIYGRIENCEIIDNYDGIDIRESFNVTVSNCVSVGNEYDSIHIWGSDNCSLLNNVLSHNREGIHIWNSDSNEIYGNHIAYCDHGIILTFSLNNKISRNVASKNRVGINLCEPTGGNLVFDNYLFNNEVNALDGGKVIVGRGNSWNVDKVPGSNIIKGRFQGGNYYSDYTGVDVDGDGLGDTPYGIAEGKNVDSHPLAKPNPALKSVFFSLSAYGITLMLTAGFEVRSPSLLWYSSSLYPGGSGDVTVDLKGSAAWICLFYEGKTYTKSFPMPLGTMDIPWIDTLLGSLSLRITGSIFCELSATGRGKVHPNTLSWVNLGPFSSTINIERSATHGSSLNLTLKFAYTVSLSIILKPWKGESYTLLGPYDFSLIEGTPRISQKITILSWLAFLPPVAGIMVVVVLLVYYLKRRRSAEKVRPKDQI